MAGLEEADDHIIAPGACKGPQALKECHMAAPTQHPSSTTVRRDTTIQVVKLSNA